MNEQVLISGAGIAGLTLAYWLARHGFRPTVVEHAPGLRAGGQGVDVRETAVEVAEPMGLMARIRALSTDVRGMKFVNAADESVGRVDMDGGAEAEIMRGDLVATLHEITEVEYVFADSIATLDQDDDGVTVTFEQGGTRRFDLVIGADGLHSTVRRLAFGPESQFLRHMDHYAAFANADAALGEDGRVTMYNTPGKMTGIYRSGNHAQAKAYFIFRSPTISYDYRDLGEQRQLLSQEFGGDSSWHVRELLDGALADPDLYFDALSQVKMASWSTGRVALVGDAAYCASPASGAGAELAITGAYRLAGELASTRGDHRAAFQRYEDGHRPLVDVKQKIGPNVRLMVPKSALGIRTRNLLTRLPLAGLERITQSKPPAPLPDYPVAPEARVKSRC